MPKYITELLSFSPLYEKKVEADFDGGEITSNAGALLLRETEMQVGIISAIASVIRDTRDLRYVDHPINDIITQRVVAKAEVNAKGDNPRFGVTNLTDPDDATVYKYLYCGRGQMENYIKDHKIYLKSDRTSCHGFTANQFRLYLHSAAYVLLQAFRENALRTTQFARAQFDTIRLNLLKIGARVSELKTKISLHLPSSFPHKPTLSKISAIFQTLSATPLKC